MYIEGNEKGLLAELTEEETLYDIISFEHMLELCKKYDINSYTTDSNSYGEFTFVTIGEKQKTTLHNGKEHDVYTTLTFYGHGIHEYREMWLNDKWGMYQNTNYNPDKIKQLNKTIIFL